MDHRNQIFHTMDDRMEACRNKMKVTRDPMSHRIIEKRRRDRMNSCLSDLSRLIPATYLKKGRGRIEKTEIIELAIKHMKQLQAAICTRKLDSTLDDGSQKSFVSKEQFYLGYQECLHEATSYLVESEGLMLADQLCVRLLSHLKQHGESVCNQGYPTDAETGFMRRNSGVGSPENASNSVGSFADVHESEFVLKKSPSSPSTRYVPSPTLEMESSTYDCAEDFPSSRRLNPSQGLVLNNQKSEVHRWQTSDSSENNQNRTPSSSNLDMEGDVGPIGGMSTCSRSSNRSDEVYKFKRNIKERFHADQKVKSDSDADDNEDVEYGSANKRMRFVPSYSSAVHHHPHRLNVGQRKNLASNLSTENVERLQLAESGKSSVPIPIFALHPKGSYYIPLTISSSVISSQLNALSHFPPALHHIGISVSFATDIFRGPIAADAITKC